MPGGSSAHTHLPHSDQLSRHPPAIPDWAWDEEHPEEAAAIAEAKRAEAENNAEKKAIEKAKWLKKKAASMAKRDTADCAAPAAAAHGAAAVAAR